MLRFKVLRTIQTVNLKIVDKLLGTRNCEADERKRINEMIRLESDMPQGSCTLYFISKRVDSKQVDELV